MAVVDLSRTNLCWAFREFLVSTDVFESNAWHAMTKHINRIKKRQNSRYFECIIDKRLSRQTH